MHLIQQSCSSRRAMLRSVLLALTVCASVAAQVVTKTPGDVWPSFRGGSCGHTAAKELPRSWGENKNIAWTVKLPGYGQSSPVVWKSRVYVTTVEGPNKDRCQVTCYRLRDGALLWSRSRAASIRIKSSRMVSRGAPTPLVDAQGIYAFFESGDLVAYTHDGELRWSRALCESYGRFEGNHGIGSSPVDLGESIALLLDHAGPSYCLCVDKSRGENVWKVDRKPRVSWSTPIVRKTKERSELVLSSNGQVAGYSIEDGSELWSIDGLKGNTVPSPSITADGAIVVGTSKGESNMLIRPELAKGVAKPKPDARDPRIAWIAEKARPTGFASPLVIAGCAVFLNKSGTLSAVSLSDGKHRWRQRAAESCWASPITDGTHLWLFGKSGQTTVLELTQDKPKLVATNEIETEETVYGIAAVDACFIIREGTRLRCVRSVDPNAKKADAEPAKGAFPGRNRPTRRRG